MRRNMTRLLAAILMAGTLSGLLVPLAFAEVADHVVIGEIYVDEQGAGSEWIELYNPGTIMINIENWVIDTKSDTDADITLPSGAQIPAHGFYFIGDQSGGSWNPDKGTWLSPDYTETMTLTDADGWVRLRSSSGGPIIDTVGWGTSTTYETSPANGPSEGESLQRKVDASTNEDGAHGPAWDTNNNGSDFFTQTSPDPQNSSQALPPVPELPAILLLSLGLVIAGGYVWFRGRSVMSYKPG